MPDIRARHDGPRRADGAAASTALAAVGVALAWWLPGQGPWHDLGLALVVLGPLGLLATLTLRPTADSSEIEAALAGDAHIDDRLPMLEVQHSVRP